MIAAQAEMLDLTEHAEIVEEWQRDEVTAVLAAPVPPPVPDVRYYIGDDEVEEVTYLTLERNAEWLRAEGIQIEFEVA